MKEKRREGRRGGQWLFIVILDSPAGHLVELSTVVCPRVLVSCMVAHRLCPVIQTHTLLNQAEYSGRTISFFFLFHDPSSAKS